MNRRKIVIEPVTRVEGHGKVTIRLDENGKLKMPFYILLNLEDLKNLFKVIRIGKRLF